jgi:hypothetical protein
LSLFFTYDYKSIPAKVHSCESSEQESINNNSFSGFLKKPDGFSGMPYDHKSPYETESIPAEAGIHKWLFIHKKTVRKDLLPMSECIFSFPHISFYCKFMPEKESEIITTHKNMKHWYLILYTLILMPIQLIYSQADNDFIAETDTDVMMCSHQAKYMLESSGKSVINPNPLMFDYDVKFYKLDLEAYDSTNQFSGYATVLVQVVAAEMDTFSIELSTKLAADSVFINGVQHSFTHTTNNIYVPLPVPAVNGSFIEFRLRYHTPPSYTSIYYSSSLDPNWSNFVVAQTISEPYFAHEFMPCKQELEDKADSVYIFITTNNDLKVAGPGLLTVVPLPDQKVRYEWRSHLKTAYYLIFFAISDYQEYTLYAKPDSLPGDSILFMNYLYDLPTVLQSSKAAIDKTPAMINLYSNKMGLFPFHEEKYGHYMWYITSFSGMEHITMTGLRSFSENLIAHELFHSWYGDHVTCATWSDIWLNEGFASYGEYIERQNLISQASADALMLSYMNYAMSSPAGSVYVPPANLNSSGRIFSTRLTYRKGCALVHMIRFQMNNDSHFFKTLYDFQQIYKDSVATGLDFKAVCEDVSGIDFTDFFNQWYFGEGYPTFSVVWTQAADTVWLNSIQTTSTTITTLFKTPVEFKLTYTGGSQTLRLTQLTNDTTFKIIIPHVVTGVTVDPNNWILNQTGTITQGHNLNLKVFLEGSFNSQTGMMTTLLNPDLLPASQPFNQLPWNYAGTEYCAGFPPDVADWVLIELRDTTIAAAATSASVIKRQAALLLKNGRIVMPDGSSPLQFDNVIQFGLYVVIRHRNHLAVLSSNPATAVNGIYSWNFTTSDSQVYGGISGCNELMPGVWGMIAGDPDANGSVGESDKTLLWQPSAGTKGYLPSDLNLDRQSDNTDKDEFWLPNLGKGTTVPE